MADSIDSFLDSKADDIDSFLDAKPAAATTAQKPPGYVPVFSEIANFGQSTADAITQGVPRGLKDLSERFSQIVQRAAPGDVYGSDFDPNMSKQNLAGAAASRYEKALGRSLNADELAQIEAEPDVAYTAATKLLNSSAARSRREFDKEATTGAQVARGATNIVPALALAKTPSGIAEAGGASGTFLRALYNAATGGAIGASEFVQPGQSRTENAVVGGAINAGVGGAVEGARNLMPARTLARDMGLKEALDTPQARRNLARYGVDRPYSQITGDATIRNIESQVSHYGTAASTAQQETIRLTRQSGKKLNQLLDEIDPNKISREGTAAKLANAFKQHTDAIDKQADDVYKGALFEANRLTQGKAFVPTDRIRSMLESRIGELRGMNVLSDDAVAELDSLQRQLAKYPAGQQLNANTVSKLLSDASSDAAGSGRVIADLKTEKDRYVANLIKGAMLDDLETAAMSAKVGPPQASERAAKVFKDARTQYGTIKDYQREQFQRAFGKLFDKNVPPTQEETYSAFMRLPASDKKDWLTKLSTFDPELRPAIKRSHFRDIIAKSGAPEGSPAGTYPIDPAKLAENWKIDHNFYTIFGDDKKAMRELIAIRKEIRLQADKITASGGGQSATQQGRQAAQIAATAISGNAPAAFTFGAGWLYNRLAPKQFEKLLLSPDGRANLLKVLKPASYNPSEVTAATMFLNRLAEEPPDEKSP